MRIRTMVLLNKFTLIVLGLSLLAWPLSSQASFPGTNGRIFYDEYTLDQSNTNIKSMKSDGTDAQTIVQGQNGLLIDSPQLSPDGKKLLYRKGNDSLVVANGDGSSPTTIFTIGVGGDGVSIGSWSPDSSKIAFNQSYNGQPTQSGIFVVNADGTGLIHVLANTSSLVYSNASWSPDGNLLAVSGTEFITPTLGGLFTVAPSVSATPTQIIANTGSIQNYRPDWKPDGSKIAFLRDTGTDATSGIFTADPNGSNVSQVLSNTNAPGGASKFALARWSPDGNKMVSKLFAISPGAMGFTMDSNGSNIATIGAVEDPFWAVPVTYIAAPGLPNTPTDKNAPVDHKPLVAAVAGLGLVGLLSLLKYRQIRNSSER